MLPVADQVGYRVGCVAVEVRGEFGSQDCQSGGECAAMVVERERIDRVRIDPRAVAAQPVAALRTGRGTTERTTGAALLCILGQGQETVASPVGRADQSMDSMGMGVRFGMSTAVQPRVSRSRAVRRVPREPRR
jgi:hypothetical protein